MFLSRVRIDLSTSRGISIAANAYNAHRFVFAAFSDVASARPLYRMESCITGATLIVQSFIEPDWTRATRMHSITACSEIKPYTCPDFANGREYRFRLIANAVRTIDDESGRKDSRGKPKRVRVPIIGDERLLEWLGGQGLKSGFTIKQAIARSGENITTTRERDGNTIRLATATFEGVLGVRDGDTLWSAIGKGFGHGKGFGLGLLSIAPLRATDVKR